MVFTQVVQVGEGSLPLVSGVAAAAKVLVVCSRESVVEGQVVVRLFRGGVVVHTDTAQTGGVLGPSWRVARSASMRAGDGGCDELLRRTMDRSVYLWRHTAVAHGVDGGHAHCPWRAGGCDTLSADR